MAVIVLATIFFFSDALRLMLVYKYGGWYSDLDMIHIRPIPDEINNNNMDKSNKNGKQVFVTRNCISGDHLQIVDLFERDGYDGSVGENLNNAIFRFDPGHAFLQACIEVFSTTFGRNIVQTSLKFN